MKNCFVCNSKLTRNRRYRKYCLYECCHSNIKTTINNTVYLHCFNHYYNSDTYNLFFVQPLREIGDPDKTITLSFINNKWIYKQQIIGDDTSSLQDLITNYELLEFFN